MAFEVVMINGSPFKCDCGYVTLKKVPTPEGEPEGDYYECQRCGSVYEMT
jgi:hypothetical protein